VRGSVRSEKGERYFAALVARDEREREAAQRTDKGSCSLPVVTLTMMWACGRGAVAVVSIVMEEEEERCRCVGVVCGMPLM
jgi:hypothetical protein